MRAFSRGSTHLCKLILILLWARLYLKRNILWLLVLWDPLKCSQVIWNAAKSFSQWERCWEEPGIKAPLNIELSDSLWTDTSLFLWCFCDFLCFLFSIRVLRVSLSADSVYDTSLCVIHLCIIHLFVCDISVCDTSVYHTSFTLMWSRQWRHAFGILVSVAAALQKSLQLANEANGKECICLQCAVSKFFAWRGVEFWRSTCWHISAHFRSTCDSEQRDSWA